MVTTEQVTTVINYVIAYGPVVWTFATSTIAAASIAAAHLPAGKPGTWWYGFKTVLNLVASNVNNARNVPVGK